MKATASFRLLLVLVVGTILTQPAEASFHFMQIEQVIGGVDGDNSAQAIQLRMRSSFQNVVSAARIRAWDATGNNPVVVIDFAQNVPSHGPGVRILIASPNFANLTNPPANPDFTMTNLIPSSYLASGSLTFEDDAGTTIYWRLSWANYSGSNSGSITNDPDGNFGPPFPGSLPSSKVQALLFQGAATAQSNNNAADYALTEGAAVFANNAGASFTVTQSGACCDDSTGDCTDGVTQADCDNQGSRYGGDASTCATIDPPCLEPVGACCDVLTGLCTNDVLPEDCAAETQEWSKGQQCEDIACITIPTVSDWGLAVMTLLVLTAGGLGSV